jgi:hypothetical protein
MPDMFFVPHPMLKSGHPITIAAAFVPRRCTACGGDGDRAWVGGFERLELRARHRGEGLPHRLSRSANEPAQLRRDGGTYADVHSQESYVSFAFSDLAAIRIGMS